MSSFGTQFENMESFKNPAFEKYLLTLNTSRKRQEKSINLNDFSIKKITNRNVNKNNNMSLKNLA